MHAVHLRLLICLYAACARVHSLFPGLVRCPLGHIHTPSISASGFLVDASRHEAPWHEAS
jgi:hypothetical protein